VSATGDVARMLTLVPWLLQRQGASIAEIADAFDVDEATIRRDLQHLDFCGLPGLGGGDLFEITTIGDRVLVRMADELRRPLRPTAREALRLVLTADAVGEALGEEVPALRSATAKVRASLGIPEAAADVLEPTGPAPSADLRAAIADGRQVRLTYQRRDGSEPTERVIDPWGLHVVDGSWYLQAHDHGAGEHRTFRLDRIVAAEVLDLPVRTPAPPDLPPPRYLPGPDDLPVTLEVTVRGRWLLDALQVDEVEDRDDGGARLTLSTDAPTYVARLVLMAGGDARVVTPASLRVTVRELATAARAGYAPAPAAD
jgi:proteasome accessory factor C